jgi:preprotein translocase subunit SecD
MRDKARADRRQQPDLLLAERHDGADFKLVATLKPQAQKTIQDFALKQNITTLHNRINELGVAEPVIQQQGADRIVVQLPGVQDTAKAKDILGRTATLEVRMVDDTPGAIEQALAGSVPFGTELYTERGGIRRCWSRSRWCSPATASPTPSPASTARPGTGGAPDARFAAGARIFRDVTRENVGKRMAILLIEKGKGEVVTAPVIRSEIGGGRVQISGRMTTVEANDVALLLRAGSLAAPMEIIEERTIGPSLGAENIEKGFNSTLWGFLAIAVFMCAYYLLFGLVSVDRAGRQPAVAGGAAVAAAGHADPARHRRHRADAGHGDRRQRADQRAHPRGTAQRRHPQAAITAGYDRAWDTILDSNITTLIAGIALLVFGSGPVRGFAVVHCLGILTSMFSAILVSRMLVNLIYGRRRKVESLSIGQVWKPEGK